MNAPLTYMVGGAFFAFKLDNKMATGVELVNCY